MAQQQRQRTKKAIAADFKSQEKDEREGELSVYTCPDCGGALWQMKGKELGFACHIGHEYSADALYIEKSHTLRQAVSEAMRTLRERATLLRQLSVVVDGHRAEAARLIEQAEQQDEHARFLQANILEGDSENPSIDDTDAIMAEIVRIMRRPHDD